MATESRFSIALVPASFSQLAGFLSMLVICWVVSWGLYFAFFHPLCRYPGPRLWAAFRVPYVYFNMCGQLPFKVAELHRQYGPVVRIAPDHLSFTDTAAWNDIYGLQPGRVQNQKDTTVYPPLPPGYQESIILSQDSVHARLRKMYGAAFTPKALDEQSGLLQKYADLLITQLKAAVKVNTIQDMSAWCTYTRLPYEQARRLIYRKDNFTTFDLTGEFAFGEAFHCLDRGGQYHFFVDTVMNGLVTGLKMQQMQHYGLLTLLKPFIPKSALKPKDDMDQYTKELVDRRLEKDHTSGTTDIFTYLYATVSTPEPMSILTKCQPSRLQQKDEEGELSRAALYENAITLVVAGSETTATLLAGATYLLCRNPEMLYKVQSEVRSAFKTDSDITSKSVNNLTYMLAVLTESMRMFPPTAFGLPRFIAAKEGQVTRVAIFHQAAYRSEQNSARPDDFVPERWLPGPPTEFKQDHRDVLQPFMVGPRGCLGKGWAYQRLRPIIDNNTDESISLANAETRLLLAKMLWHFNFELADPEDDWLASLKAFMVWERTALRIRLQAVER
ncbi:hypothetical protein LTR91_008538 [Friedmanniomyces endolithicus]|uniref:Isotrichodermin C-15 hydroxylase n=1 Tax=Friedmanniomyces endolithicus TaxID=329885 RepID=A0AAN6QUU8_9PEZI|nr:hypothetical protein LTR57_016334 [Friedmanniomyces endolithicus]KAK0991513.1 hypothetical protein LTR91_008538 [Friedmanniomyces endolithicus]KAK1039683.1 hypothetical protein LTS16_010976 [Friedmanniomyces endolithicus]